MAHTGHIKQIRTILREVIGNDKQPFRIAYNDKIVNGRRIKFCEHRLMHDFNWPFLNHSLRQVQLRVADLYSNGDASKVRVEYELGDLRVYIHN